MRAERAVRWWKGLRGKISRSVDGASCHGGVRAPGGFVRGKARTEPLRVIVTCGVGWGE